MDTEAQQTERDRSSRPSDSADVSQEIPETEGPEGRSRFALVARITDWLPGGWISLTLLVCLVFLLLLNAFVVQPFQIPSGSMENGLRIGDRVLVNKLAYRFGAEPRRGDVVVFDGTGYFGDGDYIKRVVGVGGDHVVCCDKEGRIEVNGRSVDESTFLYPGDSPSSVPFDVVVPEGTLFVLGDHRSDSSDSRDHLGSPGGGMIPVSDVIGRADWIVWPVRPLDPPAPSRRLRARARGGRRAWVTVADRAVRRRKAPSAPRTCCPPAPAAPLAARPAAREWRPHPRRAPQAPAQGQAARRRSAVKEIPLLVGVAVLIALVLKTFLVQAFVIPSGSMEQTIRIGDRVLVDKFTPWFGSEPQRGDVVVFKDPGGWLADEQTTEEERPRRRQAGQGGAHLHRPAAVRQREGPHQAGHRSRRRPRQVL